MFSLVFVIYFSINFQIIDNYSLRRNKPGSNKVNYSGARVIRVVPEDRQQLLYLFRMQNDPRVIHLNIKKLSIQFILGKNVGGAKQNRSLGRFNDLLSIYRTNPIRIRRHGTDGGSTHTRRRKVNDNQLI